MKKPTIVLIPVSVKDEPISVKSISKANEIEGMTFKNFDELRNEIGFEFQDGEEIIIDDLSGFMGSLNGQDINMENYYMSYVYID